MRLLGLLLLISTLVIAGCIEKNREEVDVDPDTLTIDPDTIETQH